MRSENVNHNCPYFWEQNQKLQNMFISGMLERLLNEVWSKQPHSTKL